MAPDVRARAHCAILALNVAMLLLAALCVRSVRADAEFLPLPAYCSAPRLQCLCEQADGCNLQNLVRGNYPVSGYTIFVSPFGGAALTQNVSLSAASVLPDEAACATVAATHPVEPWQFSRPLFVRMSRISVRSACAGVRVEMQLAPDAEGSLSGNDALGVRNVVVLSAQHVQLHDVELVGTLGGAANLTRPSALLNVTYAYDTLTGGAGHNTLGDTTSVNVTLRGEAYAGVAVGRPYVLATLYDRPYNVSGATLVFECALDNATAPCVVAWRTAGAPTSARVAGGDLVFLSANARGATSTFSANATALGAWTLGAGTRVVDIGAYAPGMLLYPTAVAVGAITEGRSVTTLGTSVTYIIIGVESALLAVMFIVECCHCSHRLNHQRRNERAAHEDTAHSVMDASHAQAARRGAVPAASGVRRRAVTSTPPV